MCKVHNERQSLSCGVRDETLQPVKMDSMMALSLSHRLEHICLCDLGVSQAMIV